MQGVRRHEDELSHGPPDQAHDDPGRRRHCLVSQGSDHDGEAVPGHHRPQERAEDRQTGVGVLRGREKIPGHEDHRDQLHAVHEAVQGHGGQSQTGRSAPHEVANGTAQVSCCGREGRGDSHAAVDPLGPELVPAQTGNDSGRERIQPRGNGETADVLTDADRDQQTQKQAEADAHSGGRTAQGRRDGVGDQQPLMADDLRQSRRQHGQQEAVDAQDDEDQDVDGRSDSLCAQAYRSHRDKTRPHEIAGQKGLTPPPAIDERTGEGADGREGQQHDDQRGGDAGGIGHVLRPEEEQCRQAGLDHPVPGLGDEAHGQQRAEGRNRGEVPQVGSQAHGSRLSHPGTMAEPEWESSPAGSRRRSRQE